MLSQASFTCDLQSFFLFLTDLFPEGRFCRGSDIWPSAFLPSPVGVFLSRRLQLLLWWSVRFGWTSAGEGFWAQSSRSIPFQTKLHGCIFYVELARGKGPRALLRELGNSLGPGLVEVATVAKKRASMRQMCARQDVEGRSQIFWVSESAS